MNKKINILLVDDFELIRITLRSCLQQLEYSNFSEATNGIEAWDILVKAHDGGNPFSMIFLDWVMPEMDGMTFLQKCRADSRFQTIPIFMVTAESERPFVLKALNEGATDYLVKPITKDRVAEALSNLKIP
jgi:two-component system chemotaxis response regulator CheY